ncbi:MAG: DUF402 domain-containing protein [bacterium]|jgi:protein associated with RNAse G/E
MKITVDVFKWDGSHKYKWPGEIVARDDAEIVVAGSFRREYRTPYCHFRAGDKTIEHYPLDAWFNICRIYRSGTELLGIYCNLSTPPVLRGNILTYIDLELDLFVYPDGKWITLDEEEYKRLAATNLPTDAADAAQESWTELLGQVKRREGPFREIQS